MAEETRTRLDQPSSNKSGIQLAKIVSHLDTSYMGNLEVQLLREVGNDTDKEGQTIQVRYLTPFYGVTNVEFNGIEPNDYNNTQKSYGFWMVPPDVGTLVLVIFADNDTKNGFWIGCVQDEKMNFMIPGFAATRFNVEKTRDQALKSVQRLPVAEYNKRNQETVADPNHYSKPVHPYQYVLKNQGLVLDDIRGITTSSARREVPSLVFGISTPGPIDKSENAKKATIGKAEHKITNAFVSRLGGSSFVMDDGDDKFLRKTNASQGAPIYGAVEQGEGGNVGIPHNELVRIRTRTGHQILLHNSEDLIYIGNARGTTWIELTSNGKIDIYAQDSISIHTENDLNVTAKRDINFNAGQNINMSAKLNVNTTAGKDTNIKSKTNINIDAETATNVKSTGTLNVGGATTNIAGDIKTSPITGEISHAKQANNSVNQGGSYSPPGAVRPPIAAQPSTIPSRVPEHEPWAGHENLDPTKCVPLKTKSVVIVEDPVKYYHPITEPPEMFKKYTTKLDTFEKVKGREK